MEETIIELSRQMVCPPDEFISELASDLPRALQERAFYYLRPFLIERIIDRSDHKLTQTEVESIIAKINQAYGEDAPMFLNRLLENAPYAPKSLELMPIPFINEGILREPLKAAIISNDVHDITVLTRMDINLANSKFKSSESPMELAIKGGCTNAVRILIEAEAKVNTKDAKGRTLLHKAAGRGHLEIVKLLLEGITDINEQDQDGRTALHDAARKGHADVCKFLMDHAADPNIPTLSGQLPVDLATDDACIAALEPNFFCDIFKAIRSNDEAAVRSLISKNPSLINARDQMDVTPLKAISRRGYANIMGILIEHGAEVDFTDKYGWTALHETCDFGRLEATKLLIEKGADINRQDTEGRTPLFFAALKNRSEVVKFLIQKGADKSIADNRGRLPVDVATDFATMNPFRTLHEQLVHLGKLINQTLGGCYADQREYLYKDYGKPW